MSNVNLPITLNLQLFDGAIDLYPQAWIYDDNYNLISTVPLIHLSNGYYTQAMLMPDLSEFYAVYRVFNDISHLIPSNKYADAADVFVRDTEPGSVMLGRYIPLSLVLFDGEENYFVKASIFDHGNLIGVRSLASRGHGLYADNSFLMPDTPEINVTYQVFTDQLMTIPSPVHSDSSEIFNKDTVNIVTQISNIISEATIDGPETLAEITGPNTQATLDAVS